MSADEEKFVLHFGGVETSVEMFIAAVEILVSFSFILGFLTELEDCFGLDGR